MGDVESVHARCITALTDIEAEDTVVATLKFRNGALGIIEATTATRPRDVEGSLSILGAGGMVEVGGFAMNEIRHWMFADTRDIDREVRERFSVRLMFMASAIRLTMITSWSASTAAMRRLSTAWRGERASSSSRRSTNRLRQEPRSICGSSPNSAG